MEELKNQVNIAAAEDEGQDMLLVQIDAFREKAKTLQKLINSKEKRVKELETLVSAKETRNKELEIELEQKQKEVDGIVTDVEQQVDKMLGVVKANMEMLQLDIKQQVQDSMATSEEQNRAIEEQNKAIEEQNRELAKQSEKIQEQTNGLRDSLKTMSEGLETIHSELMEKTHTENVRLYRNIQDLMDERDNEEDDEEVVAERNAIKKKVNLLTIFAGVNIAATVIAIIVAALAL